MLQEIFDKMSKELKEELMVGYTRSWENRLILYAIENDVGNAEKYLKEGGVISPRLCQGCYNRGYTGKRNGIPILCKCIYKQVRRRSPQPLNIEWRRNERLKSEEPIKPTSKTANNQGQGD